MCIRCVCSQITIEKAVEVEEKLFGDCFETHDQVEGMSCFLSREKPKPKAVFTNKMCIRDRVCGVEEVHADQRTANALADLGDGQRRSVGSCLLYTSVQNICTVAFGIHPCRYDLFGRNVYQNLQLVNRGLGAVCVVNVEALAALAAQVAAADHLTDQRVLSLRNI